MPPALGNQQLEIYLSERPPVASLQLILPRTFFAPPCSTLFAHLSRPFASLTYSVTFAGALGSNALRRPKRPLAQ